MTTASALRRIARASVGLLVAGVIAGQAAPAFADPAFVDPVRPVAHATGLAPAGDPGTPDPDPGGQTDLTPGGQTDLTPGAGSSGTGSWDTATALVTDKDGRTTTLKAPTVAYCISVGHSLTLDDGQDVPFEKMSKFEITRADELHANGGKAEVAITLTTGAELTGTFDSNCDIIGYSEVGRFSIYPQKLESVEFRRTGAAPASTTGGSTPGSGTDPSETSETQVSGIFEVTGSEPTAINIVTDPAGRDGVASHYNVKLPWTGEFTAPTDTDVIQVVVVGGGKPTCKITWGGEVVAQQDENGNGHCVFQRTK